MTNRKTTPTPFNKKLVLNQYILSLFGVKCFHELAKCIDNPRWGEFSDDEVSRFCRRLIEDLDLDSNAAIDVGDLYEYDANITAHTKKMKNREGAPIKWMYFQYLALLFTEIYLDRYFNHREELIAALNAYLPQVNNGLPAKEQLPEFTEDDLRRIAFWSATGSGKTLIMHMNIHQMLHYLEKAKRRRDFNRILLVTPNAGLSKQHLKDMRASGFQAEIFSKDNGSTLKSELVEIIEITKFEEKDGKDTVSIDSFEQNNFVLIDEGHRGSSGDKWSGHRRKLAKEGFAIEYSATLGQAAATKPALAKSYAKSILFDYSYRHFYGDGYGKKHRIFNLPNNATDKETLELYLTACLLSFYQQKKLFADDEARAQEFNIENPLCVFVGSSVNKQQGGEKISDVVNMLLFLARLTNPKNKSEVIARIEQIQNGSDALENVFAKMFRHLIAVSAADIYDDMLQKIFNASAGATLRIYELKGKGADGEIALRLGANNEDFGVINVGDASNLRKHCEEQDGLKVSSRNFTTSLFRDINAPESNLHMLIGSKRFSEGWNSWRVSTMGMMNVGKGEGSQVIQLFGRGVRLWGHNRCLKRHSELGLPENKKLEALETLNIFGVNADYMKQFKKYLENEDIPETVVEISVPVIKQLPKKKLKIIKIPDNLDFRKDGGKPILTPPSADFAVSKVSLDYHSRIQKQVEESLRVASTPPDKHPAWLSTQHLAMLNYDDLYFDLQQFKKARGWFNLVINKSEIKSILGDSSWYELFIPEGRLEFKNYENVKMWQSIASTLMKKYCERFYQVSRSEWEVQHRQYKSLQENDGNFIEEHKIFVDKSQTMLIKQIHQLCGQINTNLPTANVLFGSNTAIFFDRHLYQPLIALGNQGLRVQPVGLNKGEKTFIDDLRSYLQEEDLTGKELYLLRNQTRGKGVGFFEANNFYPDFILWLVEGNMQRIAFIDPKGLMMLTHKDRKLNFYSEIKAIETRMADKQVKLYSFIISGSKYDEIKEHYPPEWSEADFKDRNILFQDGLKHIEEMMNKIMV